MSQLKLIEGLIHVGHALDSNKHLTAKPGKAVLTLAAGLETDPDEDGFYKNTDLRTWGRGINLLTLDDRIAVETPNKMKVLSAIEHAVELACGERYRKHVSMIDCILLWERIIRTVRILADKDKSWTGTLLAYTQGLHTLKDMIRLRDLSRQARKKLVFEMLSLGGPRSVQSMSNVSGFSMELIEDTVSYLIDRGFAQLYPGNDKYVIIVPSLRCPGKGGHCGKRILEGCEYCYFCAPKVSYGKKGENDGESPDGESPDGESPDGESPDGESPDGP